MRLDKYLWFVRIFKTRTIATKACNTSKISINDKSCKASRVVKEGDVLNVKKNGIVYSFKILGFPKSRVGAKLVEEYRKDLTPQSELDKLLMIRAKFIPIRDAGTGRPTKKERRDMEDFFSDDEIFDEWLDEE